MLCIICNLHQFYLWSLFMCVVIATVSYALKVWRELGIVKKVSCLDKGASKPLLATLDNEFVRYMIKTFEDESTHDLVRDAIRTSDIITQPLLHDFFRIRGTDAMEWMLRCGIGDMDFEQSKEDEIPILCKYYNEFIGEEAWTKNEHTMMEVLKKYEAFKSGGYGNFLKFKTV